MGLVVGGAMSRSFSATWLTQIEQKCSPSANHRLLLSRAIPTNLHQKSEQQSPAVKQAAVLIPLCNRHNEASVLFNLRSQTVGTHKGHVSFPGGHLNPGETPTEAAVRECYEELGSNIGEIKVLGVCQTVPAITGTLVTPVIAFLCKDVEEFEHFQPNKDEVSSVFSRSISTLTSDGYRKEELLGRPGMEKKILFPYFGEGELRIWGLTAFILDAVLKEAILPVPDTVAP